MPLLLGEEYGLWKRGRSNNNPSEFLNAKIQPPAHRSPGQGWENSKNRSKICRHFYIRLGKLPRSLGTLLFAFHMKNNKGIWNQQLYPVPSEQ